jgi:CrcB protein
MLKLLIVGVGGFVGAIGRYLVSGLVHRLLDGRFPYGTMVVNIIGCFLLGMFMFFVARRGMFSPYARLLISIGLLGAFTTYSTFAYETFRLVVNQRLMAAFVNIAVQLAGGLLAIGAAMIIGRAIIK